jgi:thiamine biosynthesis lipoprotein
MAERRFRAMGADAHVVVNGPEAEAAVDVAVARIEDLERRWSRFRPDSEVSRLNRAEGVRTIVSTDTFTLVEKAVFAWHVTEGAFDPTMLGALERLGYDRSFDSIGETDLSVRPSPATSSAGAGGIEVDRAAHAIRLPAGATFDPGGIGKGLAADIVSGELVAQGAWGAMVNLGGDLRVRGVPPEGLEWVISVREPTVDAAPLARLRLQDAGVATSTTRRRRWSTAHGERHHLLDPATSRPHAASAELCTVVAGAAWWAEVCATASIGADPETLPNHSALRVFADGRRELHGSFEGHTF